VAYYSAISKFYDQRLFATRQTICITTCSFSSFDFHFQNHDYKFD
jgi:hypothetical protein